jgi:hypothetical protein
MGEHQPQLAPPPILPFRHHPLANEGMVRVDQRHLARKAASDVLQCVAYFKGDFGLCHAPVANFFGNWAWWHAAALAYNVAPWLRALALPEPFATCRGKRLRSAFLNVAAKVVRGGRRLKLRPPRAYAHAGPAPTPGLRPRRAYAHAQALIDAIVILRRLPTFTWQTTTKPEPGDPSLTQRAPTQTRVHPTCRLPPSQPAPTPTSRRSRSPQDRRRPPTPPLTPQSAGAPSRPAALGDRAPRQ